jgi:CubicO group peptidase (beta-lactamase class C family)
MASISSNAVNPCAGLAFPACDSADTGACIDAAVKAFMDFMPGVPGVMVSAQAGGTTVYTRGYGAATAGGPAPTASMSFQIDSLTKVFTAFAVLRLYEQGIIAELTDPIGAYMADLPRDDWKPIRIDQLLAMVSGIPSTGSATEPYTESLKRAAAKPLRFEPGTRYEYSNSNFFLLGRLVDTLAGSFMDYTRSEVLDVVGMPDTGLIPFQEANHPATPFQDGSAGVWRNPDCGYSGGGFASTMADLQAFAEGLARGAVLRPATYARMWSPYRFGDGTHGPFGLGWDVTDGPAGTLWKAQKNGGGYGWNTQLVYVPAGAHGPAPSVSACVLMNAAGCPGPLANEIVRIVLAAASAHAVVPVGPASVAVAEPV